MKSASFKRTAVNAALLAGLAAAFGSAIAAPTISRLTPPSELFASNNPNAPYIARFLPDQRFDLQVTVQPQTGNTVTAVTFAVDGVTVGTVTAGATNAANTSIITTGLGLNGVASATLPAGSAVVSLRAYSNTTPGVHVLTATATQSDGTSTTATGNFEVVGTTAQGRPVKNIIILLGDGMGAAHRTAGRIVAKGYAQGKAKGLLAMDTFPFTGMVMTSSLDTIITDSAPGMANYVNGNKANSGQEGVWPDDTTAAFDNPRIEYLSEYLHRKQGKKLGIVTTADVFDATPAANAVHTAARGNGTGIVDQFLDDRNLTGLTVLMGGGRKWFLPAGTPGTARATGSDYDFVAGGNTDIVAGWGAAPGSKDTGRDLIANFQSAGFTYAPNNTTLQSAGVPDKLLGLFSYSNMNVAFDKIAKRRAPATVGVVDDFGFPDQPMLDEMADKALQVLNKNNTTGFVLMVEGASIDKQAHAMDTDRWMQEVIEFDRAVQKAKDFATANPDTLVIVTADHECSGAAIIGATRKTKAELQALATGADHTAATQRDPVIGNYQDAGFPAYAISADGYPADPDIKGKLVIGYGSNADRYETYLSNVKPTQDSQQPFNNVATGTPGAAGVAQTAANGYAATAQSRNTASTSGGVTGVFITGQTSFTSGGNQATHTAADVPLSAFGRGASLFTGYFDNTDVFFKFGQAAIGGVK
jgi:alkaline phosphatase